MRGTRRRGQESRRLEEKNAIGVKCSCTSTVELIRRCLVLPKPEGESASPRGSGQDPEGSQTRPRAWAGGPWHNNTKTRGTDPRVFGHSGHRDERPTD